jgi:ubiquitin carboxyl-terminal hydrolase 5/13
LSFHSQRQKTVKSTAELEVELNATYAFDAITEAGANLVPVSGPTLQGLQNLGNSCYMNSVVQLLLSGTVPELARRYGGLPGENVAHHALFQECTPRDAPTDLLCQTAKLSLALTSGAFAVPESILTDETQKDVSLDPKYRIQPRMFKHVVASDHVDFRTGQQQDAGQFLLYLLERLDSAERHGAQRFGADEIYPSSHLFSFRTTTRLVCGSDQKIKYKDSAPGTMLSLPVPMDKATLQVEPEQKRHKVSESSDSKDEDKAVPTVAFSACLDSWAAETTLDDFRWSHLGNSVAPTTSQNRLSNFPRYFLVHILRYTLGADWTPQKLEVNLDIPQDLDLAAYRSEPPREGEDLVIDDDMPISATPQTPSIDENAVAQLMDMGFTFNGCKRALTAVGGSDVEAAMTWVFEHNMDPDFNDPLPEGDETAATSVDSDGIDEGLVMNLVENLGCFSVEHVRAALKHSGGASDQAADWLFSNMDDLDRAVAALSVKPHKAESMPSAGPALPLDDGEGKYTMVGMISHIGKHTGSGHYVAHLKRDDKWVIFNDEKVAISATPPFAHAYIYLYQRNDAIGSPDPHY